MAAWLPPFDNVQTFLTGHDAKQRSSSMLHARFTNRVYGLPIDLEADGALYNELAAEISELRGEAEKMFELNGLGAPSLEPCSGSNIHHFGKERSLDMFLRGFLPYDLDAADDVIWQIYRGSGKHRGPLYFKSSKVFPRYTQMN